jgi:hypothetical protein
MSLGDILRDEKALTGLSLEDLTVLSTQNDPFRLDTKANHVNGRWFRDRMEECGLLEGNGTIHNRGIHYAIVSLGNAVRPDGRPYQNDDDSWAFLEKASNIARWLRYVKWSRVVDARNADPVIRVRGEESDTFSVHLPAEQFMPEDDDLIPCIRGDWSAPRQPYRLALYGEKTSLGNVLAPIAEQYDADLYLPSGEISNTLLAQMAAVGADDGREMVVAVFADCDPAGYQMAVSIGHKLRALKDSLYPNSLAFRVITPALTVEQVMELGLPSTPLKATELRADGWRARYGVSQTEIDALATLRPNVLSAIAREALDPFFDHTLAERHEHAAAEWQREAQRRFEGAVGHDEIEGAWERAVQARAELEARVTELRELASTFDGFLPEFLPPSGRVCGNAPSTLVRSDMPLAVHAGILRKRKDYSANDNPATTTAARAV